MAAAMNFLSNTDAMIIDLRQNGGGDPSGVQVVCSYFFGEKPVHLNSIYFRPTDETHEFWTLENVDAPRFLDKPVYVLVSKRTGSGAEECSYNLQQLKRATIIGEPTWGGANPGGSVRLHDHFSCFIPVGRAINPITKTNWEGSGVIPDIKCDPAKSLEQAQVLILKELIAKEKDENYKSALEARLKALAQG
ncbi:MAG: S41 family peptidase [Fimbriimonadaceae bacterium]